MNSIFKEPWMVRENNETPPTPEVASDDDSIWYDIPFGVGDAFKVVGSAFSVIGSGAKAASSLANATAHLVDGLSRAVDFATTQISTGIVVGEKKIGELYTWAKDNIKGKPEGLPEYGWMIKNKNFKGLDPAYLAPFLSDGGKRVSELTCRMALLDAQIYQLQAMYQPVLAEMSKLGTEKARRERVDWKSESERTRLTQSIQRKEEMLNNGYLPEGSTRDDILFEKNQDERSLKALEGQNSKTIMWNMPLIQRTEFPAGSGIYVNRFVSGTKMVKVDIDRLSDQFSSYLYGYEPALKLYTKEKLKLFYWRQKIVEDKSQFTEADKAIMVEYNKALQGAVDKVKADGTKDFKKDEAAPIYNVIDNPIEIRKARVGVVLSKEFLAWVMHKKLPERLQKFGCSVVDENGVKKIVKGPKNNFEFFLKQDGSVDTKYPDGIDKTLPPNADPNDKNAWKLVGAKKTSQAEKVSSPKTAGTSEEYKEPIEPKASASHRGTI